MLVDTTLSCAMAHFETEMKISRYNVNIAWRSKNTFFVYDPILKKGDFKINKYFSASTQNCT